MARRPPRTRDEDLVIIDKETIRSLGAAYFRGGKRAFGTGRGDNQFRGIPYQEAGRDWCTHLQWCRANSPYQWEYGYKFTPDGAKTQLEIYSKQDLELLRTMGPEFIMGELLDGNGLQKLGIETTVALMKFVDANF